MSGRIEQVGLEEDAQRGRRRSDDVRLALDVAVEATPRFLRNAMPVLIVTGWSVGLSKGYQMKGSNPAKTNILTDGVGSEVFITKTRPNDQLLCYKHALASVLPDRGHSGNPAIA
jgi:hypothetical protein